MELEALLLLFCLLFLGKYNYELGILRSYDIHKRTNSMVIVIMLSSEREDFLESQMLKKVTSLLSSDQTDE